MKTFRKTIPYHYQSNFEDCFYPVNGAPEGSFFRAFFEGSIFCEATDLHQTSFYVLMANQQCFVRFFGERHQQCCSEIIGLSESLSLLLTTALFPIFLADHISQRVMYNLTKDKSVAMACDKWIAIRQSTLWSSIWSHIFWTSTLSILIWGTSSSKSNQDLSHILLNLSLFTFSLCSVTAVASAQRFHRKDYETQLRFSSIAPELPH